MHSTGRASTREHAKFMIAAYVKHYNYERLHSAIGYVLPMAKLEGQDGQIWEERKRKLMEAKKKRELTREQMGSENKTVIQMS